MRRLRKTILESFLKAVGEVQIDGAKADMKRLLLELALGRMKSHPFGQEAVDRVRSDLRIILKESGHGDGLPREGDRVQVFGEMALGRADRPAAR